MGVIQQATQPTVSKREFGDRWASRQASKQESRPAGRAGSHGHMSRHTVLLLLTSGLQSDRPIMQP
jgi:hypothetical protein